MRHMYGMACSIEISLECVLALYSDYHIISEKLIFADCIVQILETILVTTPLLVILA